MASDFFCFVQGGEILQYNIPAPTSTALVSFGTNTTDDEYRLYGYWPIVDIPLDYNIKTQYQKKEYAIDDGEQIVHVVYTNIDKDLTSVITDKIADLAAFRYNVEVSDYYYNEHPFQCDRESQNRLTALFVVANAGLLTSIDYKTDAGFVTMTADDINNLSEAILGKVQTAYTKESTYKIQIEALTTNADVDAFDFTSGWPSDNNPNPPSPPSPPPPPESPPVSPPPPPPFVSSGA